MSGLSPDITKGSNDNNNTNPEVLAPILVTSTTWVNIAEDNPSRLSFRANNDGNQKIYIRQRAATPDAIIGGVSVEKEKQYELPGGDTCYYKGAVSALASVGSQSVSREET